MKLNQQREHLTRGLQATAIGQLAYFGYRMITGKDLVVCCLPSFFTPRSRVTRSFCWILDERLDPARRSFCVGNRDVHSIHHFGRAGGTSCEAKAPMKSNGAALVSRRRDLPIASLGR
jgi:hypothetical protein